MKRLLLVLLVCMALIMPRAASADNLPRDYIPAPPGCLALLLYYFHTSADTFYHAGHKVTSDFDFSANTGLMRPVYYFEAGPFMMNVQFLAPFGQLELDTNTEIPGSNLTSSGFGDMTLLSTIWFIHDSQSKTWLGFTPYFTFPTGNYENNGALSIGGNRFAFKEELGFVKGFEVMPGHSIYFDLTLAGDFFLDNDEFGAFGPHGNGRTLSQDPVLTVESHLSYDLTKEFLIAFDYYYHFGGETSIDGFGNNDDQVSNHRIGFTAGYNIVPSVQLLFQYAHDVDVREGALAQQLTFRFLYACDVGYLFGTPSGTGK